MVRQLEGNVEKEVLHNQECVHELLSLSIVT
jgi:hypothetical protein